MISVAPLDREKLLNVPLVPVSVNERLVPHLATRAECYVFPTGMDRAQWVLEFETSLARENVSRFEIVARERGWALLRRASDG